ncbi:FkbM family methyltransferase [Antarcticibacterium sp. 1MA-6-2]|uniref:FkbM family methyltransferase n=1 Tax=Antarcticibacterium sp. 1MA-6-2 TaxID=2908210 RepID=UPI001F00DCAC|nr:FkbM family methyltransferase [Antarcticibacterium sp. 1MA-6-2]UJH92530.1 FkbM family methyltransferase [Antarcticibacterium sp. 1MA-6-2]
MSYKKIKKIYRILFPAKYSEKDVLENLLRTSKEVLEFEEMGSHYKVILSGDIELKVRNSLHSDIKVFHQIFNKRDYDLVLKMLLLNSTGSENVIIDAGANVGYTTLFLYNKLKNSKFFLIEPEDENFQMIVKNTSNIPSDKLKLYNCALGAEGGGTFILKRDFRDGKDWSFSTEPDSSGDIMGKSLNEIIRENKLKYISLLKIDIEGAERFIFSEKSDLSFLDITQVLAIEIHDEFQIRQVIYQKLKDHDFYLLENGDLTIGINRKL